MKRRVVVMLLLGFTIGLGGCASVPTVIQSRADAVKKYNYAGKEDFLEVEGASLTPDTASPGQAVQTAVQYVVLAPSATQQVMVVESRTLVGANDSVLLSRREVNQEQGPHSSTMKFTLPTDIAKGKYTLVTTISYAKQTKTVRRVLSVI